MYGHQVLKSINQLLSKSKCMGNEHEHSLIKESLSMGLYDIPIAQHFHFGDISGVADMLVPKLDGSIIFSERGLKLPYNVCWFDYRVTKDVISGDQMPSTKRGFIIKKVRRGYSDDIICAQLYFYLDQLGTWLPSIVKWLISLNGELFLVDGIETPTKSLPITGFERQWCNQAKDDEVDIGNLYMILILLSCKNITTETVRVKQPKGKKKNKKFFDYKILKYQPGKASKKYAGKGDENLESMPVHLCRGHFKNYTKDNPLFGRITGRYWWQPHCRGHIKNGIVEKDYEVVVK